MINTASANMAFTAHAKSIRRDWIQDNYRALMQQCETRDEALILKITNFLENHNLEDDYTIDDILQKITTDKITARYFAKDPTKQNIYEICQFEWLKSDFPDIKKCGNIYFEGSRITNRRDRNKTLSTKSIDLISEDDNAYFACKHINQAGGSQRNQWLDVCNFIKEYKNILKANNDNHILYVVVSGPYFETTMAELEDLIDGVEKIKILNLDIPEWDSIPDNKKNLGQFYTTNGDKILQGLAIPDIPYIKIIEPFVGNGDLLNFIQQTGNTLKPIECYDLEPLLSEEMWDRVSKVETRDTLLDPPNYKDSIVITNPPYLARNKYRGGDTTVFDRYNTNDLYKCFLMSLIEGNALGGILILPLNFLCSTMKKIDLRVRDRFLRKYKITKLNIFEEPMFDDTGYSVCSFSFEGQSELVQSQTIDTHFLPSGKNITINIKRTENWIIGYEIGRTFKDPQIKIRRLLKGEKSTSNLLLRSIDTGTADGKINLRVVPDDQIYYGKDTSRNEATISWNISLDLSEQAKIANLFNNYINTKREKYNNLFLTNFRDTGRKRIAFELAFGLVNTAICKYCQSRKITVSSLITL